MSSKECEELEREFEGVLDELETLKISTGISVERLFKRIGTLKEQAKNARHALQTERSRLEIDLVLPLAAIDGLYFNEQNVHAVFEKYEDGWYYSEDILFLSARNVENDNSRDILTEYLNKSQIRERIATALDVPPEDIEIALPQETRGVKKYHGVNWWYWLAAPDSPFDTYFCNASNNGNVCQTAASSVGGCAPAFRVRDN
ncbi:MAG: hypothetical protein LBK00_04535 [Treponema sp.]|jgi:hypothetical protein|nr:hypothetical protein [Treponema sp.]